MDPHGVSTRRPAAGLSLVLLFCAFSVASFLYCLLTGTYNGDFIFAEVTLSPMALIAVLALAILPFATAWALYGWLRKLPPSFEVDVPQRGFTWLLIAVFGWYIFITLAFGVGIALRETYTAPAGILFVIQVLNRLDPTTLGVLYILASPKKLRYEFLPVVLIIVLGLTRASIGGFLFLGIAFAYKYFDDIVRSRKKVLAAGAIVLLGIPAMATVLYEIRGSLREEVAQEIQFADLIFAQLVGRLSSYSDTAYIIQDAGELSAAAEQMPAFYYQQQILGSLIHSVFLPDSSPEKILVTHRAGFEVEFVGFMPGVPGNLYLSYLKSGYVFLMNLATFVLLVAGVLFVSNHFARPALKDAGLLLLLYPLTSGVSSELARALFSLVIVMGVFWLARRRPGKVGATPVATSEGDPGALSGSTSGAGSPPMEAR
jgi:hypothetical protein